MGVGVYFLINVVREKSSFRNWNVLFFFFFQSRTTEYILIGFYISFPVCPTHSVSCAVCLFCIRPATGTLFQLEFSQIIKALCLWIDSRLSVQLLSCVQLFATPWTAACQASLSITNSRRLLKLMSIESVMPSNRLILCRPLLLLPSIFPSIWVSSKQSVLLIRWPKYWSFSFSISPSKEYSGLISFRTDWISLQSKGLSKVFSNTTV